MTQPIGDNPFLLSAEQALIAEAAQRFVREQAARGASAGGCEAFSAERWRTYADLGWLAVAVPEDCGGFGGGMAEVAALMQGLGPGLLPDPLITSSVLAAALLHRAEVPEVREAWLAKLAAGEVICAVACAECSGQGGPGLRAERQGEGFLLSGVSIVNWHAPHADTLLLTAHIEGEAGYSIFLVDATAKGLTLDGYQLLDGTAAADLTLDRVRLDASALLIGCNGAGAALEEAFNRAIVAHCAEVVGIARDTLEETKGYLSTRVQFGRPLAQFQALQHGLAEMFVRYQDAISMLQFVVQAFDQGDPAEHSAAASVAKVVIGDAAHYIAAQAIQLHGAIGVTEEYKIGRYYRKILVFEKMFGDAGFHMQRYEQNRPSEGRFANA